MDILMRLARLAMFCFLQLFSLFSASSGASTSAAVLFEGDAAELVAFIMATRILVFNLLHASAPSAVLIALALAMSSLASAALIREERSGYKSNNSGYKRREIRKCVLDIKL